MQRDDRRPLPGLADALSERKRMPGRLVWPGVGRWFSLMAYDLGKNLSIVVADRPPEG